MKKEADFRGGRRTTSNPFRAASRAMGMRTALAAALVAGMSMTVLAQDFQNLDFELGGCCALPGWTAYCGSNHQTTVQYNFEWLDTAGISILDFDSSFDPAAREVTRGQYCVALYSGFQRTGADWFDAETWIAQTGRIPASSFVASSLLFNYSTSASSSAWGDGRVIVTFNGIALPWYIVTGGASGFSVRGVDVRPFAGQVGELRFTAPTGFEPGHWRSMFLLDYIRFSPLVMQARFIYATNNGEISITGFSGPAGALIIPDTIDSLPVTSMGDKAFYLCESLTSVTLPNTVTSIGRDAFHRCYYLTNVTIGNSVTSIGRLAFARCSSLKGVYFQGNAPSADSTVFYNDYAATVYYLPGTTGWGSTFGGRPTALYSLPAILTPPSSQTAEVGSTAAFNVGDVGSPPLTCQWWFSSHAVTDVAIHTDLVLTNIQPSQSGNYFVIVSNGFGSVTSAPAMLNVIPPVERRWVPGLIVSGQPGNALNLETADTLLPAPNWAAFESLLLTEAAQWYFDLSAPLPAQRFFRAWQPGVQVAPALDAHLIPALTLTGSIGSTVRVEGINQFGPTDAWFPLATVTLTNTSQLYFDVSVIGQPPRLWRLIQVP